MSDFLVGIDAGTTGCKSIVFDLDGNVLGQDYREYPCVYPGPGLVEQRYEDIIPPLTDSCREAVAASGVSPEEIRAVAFSSQAPLLALVDAEGNLIRDFLSWQDLRGAPYIPKLREAYGAERFYLETGDPLGTNSAAPKWAWLRDNEPENWARTEWFLSEQEFLLKEWGADGYWTDLSSASGCSATASTIGCVAAVSVKRAQGMERGSLYSQNNRTSTAPGGSRPRARWRLMGTPLRMEARLGRLLARSSPTGRSGRHLGAPARFRPLPAGLGPAAGAGRCRSRRPWGRTGRRRAAGG